MSTTKENNQTTDLARTYVTVFTIYIPTVITYIYEMDFILPPHPSPRGVLGGFAGGLVGDLRPGMPRGSVFKRFGMSSMEMLALFENWCNKDDDNDDDNVDNNDDDNYQPRMCGE